MKFNTRFDSKRIESDRKNSKPLNYYSLCSCGFRMFPDTETTHLKCERCNKRQIGYKNKCSHKNKLSSKESFDLEVKQINKNIDKFVKQIILFYKFSLKECEILKDGLKGIFINQ